MEEPKYRVRQNVTINGKGNYVIREVAKHGRDTCDCCQGEAYFMYRISSTLWINEDQLFPIKTN